MLIPINGFEALAAGVRRSPILLLKTETVVPEETRIPVTVDDAELPERSQMVFLKILVAVFPVLAIPIMAEPAVVESVLTALSLILIVVEVFELVIPVTFPPKPVEVKLVMVLEEMVNGVARLAELPIVIPVIAD